MAYRLVIGADIPDIEYEKGDSNISQTLKRHWFQIDKCDSRNIVAQSHISSQPMQSGEIISDHMYREPITETISGWFSLNGKNWNDNVYEEIAKGSTDRITAIETVFEFIKDGGYLCELTTFNDDSTSSDPETRFLRRKNMCLENISWAEHQNSIQFTFTFKEIILVDMIEYEVDSTDVYLPTMKTAAIKTLGQALYESESGRTQFIQDFWTQLVNDKYITTRFLEKVVDEPDKVKAYFKDAKYFHDMTIEHVTQLCDAMLGINIGLGIAIGTIALAAHFGVTVGSIFPVGTAVVGIGVAVLITAITINKIIKKKKEKAKAKKIIDLINDKTDSGLVKLRDLTESVMTKVEKANLSIVVATIDHLQGVDETTGAYIPSTNDYQTLLTVGDYYFRITFTFNKLSQDWGWTVENVSTGDSIPVGKYVCKDLSECVPEHRWFKSDSTCEYEIYLVYMDGSNDNQTAEELNCSKKCLNNYSIWVSKGNNFQENLKQIDKAIDEAIASEGY